MENRKQENEELAKNYIDEHLDDGQLEGVLKKVKTDDSFAKELAFQMALKKTFEEEAIVAANIKEITASFNKKETPTKPNKVIPIRKLLAIAATIIALAVVGVLVNTYLSNRADNQEFAKAISMISTEAHAGSVDWQTLIEKNNYDDALEQIITLRNGMTYQGNPCENEALNYFGGVLLLYKKKDYSTATNYLKCVVENKNIPADKYPNATKYYEKALELAQ